MSEEKKHQESMQDDEAIDFSKLKQKITGLFNRNKEKTETKHTFSHSSEPSKTSDDSLSIDFKQVKSKVKKNAKWLIPLVCILFAVFVSVYLRTMPQRMPIADDWAENTVTNYYQDLIEQQIDQQYSYVPEQNKQSLINKEWLNFQKQNKENLDDQVKTIAQQYRDNFKDDQGTLYLLGIDPYHFYRQTQNILENGIPGTGYFEDGLIKDDLRIAPLGGASEWSFHNWFSAAWHKLLNLFGDILYVLLLLLKEFVITIGVEVISLLLILFIKLLLCFLLFFNGDFIILFSLPIIAVSTVNKSVSLF